MKKGKVFAVAGVTLLAADLTTNIVDGLMENDKYGNLVPSLAEDWSVSKDGLTYTYKIRKGVKWYDADGEERGEVTAKDFVTGLKHAADKKSEELPLVQGSIKGLDDYVQGKTTDFSQVGVKAVDDYTLQYTLNKPETFWNSKTTNGILFPISTDFLKSKGDDFGQPNDVKSTKIHWHVVSLMELIQLLVFSHQAQTLQQ